MLATFWRIPLALSLLEMQEFEAALKICTQIRGRTEGSCLRRPLLYALALSAFALYALERRDEATDTLARTLSMARAFDLGGDFGRLHRIMPRLSAEALSRGIETDFVRDLIRRFAWGPPSPHAYYWVWPVKIVTLGRFAVFKDDAVLTFGRKAPRRPLALLKCLVAHGARDVDIRHLEDLLWPDSEGDAAESTLEAALFRLRKLLGRDDAIVREDGRLSVNSAGASVDVWAFEQHAETLGAPVCNKGPAHWERLKSVETVLRLYAGPFLSEDMEEPWTRDTRSHLQFQFRRAVLSAGEFFERAQLWREAVAVYQAGIQRDKLAEELSQRLTMCRGQVERSTPASPLELQQT